MKKIKNFMVEYCKTTKEKFLTIDGEVVKTKNEFLIGYTYGGGGTYGIDGEYILIDMDNGGISIQNDPYSSYPIYIYEDKKDILMSSSLFQIVSKKSLNISLEKLYTYFAFGYIPVSDQTIYENVRVLPPDSRVFFNDNGAITFNLGTFDLFFKHQVLSDDMLIKHFLVSVNKKIKAHDGIDNSIFCLSGGLDTALGILAMNNIVGNIDTITWGLKESMDVIEASKRRNKIMPMNIPYRFIIDDVKIRMEELADLSNLTGGLSTSANIYLLLVTKELISMGKKVHFYCDHYEATRRIINYVGEIQNNYTMPEELVSQYFKTESEYWKNLNGVINQIPYYYRYKNDPIMEWYFYDRYIKGTFYKNAIINQCGGIKVTLPLDYNFLNYNHAYVRGIGKSYDMLLEAMKKKTGKEIVVDSNRKKRKKDFPFNPKAIIKDVKGDILDLLSSASAKELSLIVNISKVRDVIISENYREKEEWFILKLLNLIIFKHCHNLEVI